MPPNRFESEVESFLEGSHGDRTHIKRADHPRLHHYAGRYCSGSIALATKQCNGSPSSAIPTGDKLNRAFQLRRWRRGRRVGCEPDCSTRWRDILRPARGISGLVRDKIRPADTKSPNLGCFERAGRVLSRVRGKPAEQGEFSLA